MADHATTRRGFLFGLPAGLGLSLGVQKAEAAGGSRRVIPGSPYPTFSRAVEWNGLIYVAGVVGQKPGSRELAGDDFATECRQAMENLKASVHAAGSTMSKVLKCGVFLTDYDDFRKFNEIYVGYFPSDPPARSTVVVKGLVVPDARLEIDCVTTAAGRPE